VCTEAGVVLANLNCPGQIVISGEAGKIAQACELAKVKVLGGRCRCRWQALTIQR